jgi:hypothetical protein
VGAECGGMDEGEGVGKGIHVCVWKTRTDINERRERSRVVDRCDIDFDVEVVMQSRCRGYASNGAAALLSNRAIEPISVRIRSMSYALPYESFGGLGSTTIAPVLFSFTACIPEITAGISHLPANILAPAWNIGNYKFFVSAKLLVFWC